jgi:hypothetical protein
MLENCDTFLHIMAFIKGKLKLETTASERNCMSNSLLCHIVFRIRIHLIRIGIQHFTLNTDPDPVFMTKNCKNLQLKIKYLPIPRPS